MRRKARRRNERKKRMSTRNVTIGPPAGEGRKKGGGENAGNGKRPRSGRTNRTPHHP